jgi:hypothetical protein
MTIRVLEEIQRFEKPSISLDYLDILSNVLCIIKPSLGSDYLFRIKHRKGKTMKNKIVILTIIITAALLTSCGLVQFAGNTNSITPSTTTTTETRTVSGFTGIDFSTFGTVNVSQGSSESLTIEGRDNLVPLVTTTVRNGTLYIGMEPNVNVTGLNTGNLLTFTITVKDLSSVNISGLGNLMMDALSTTDLKVSMSGAGQFKLNNLTATTVGIDISGLGNVEIAGTAASANVNISGAGNANCPDLQLQTVKVNIPGLGNATLWVTNQLTGTISGAGSVSYYGSPQTNTNVTGLGRFKPLGPK